MEDQASCSLFFSWAYAREPSGVAWDEALLLPRRFVSRNPDSTDVLPPLMVSFFGTFG